MRYNHIDILDSEVPRAAEPIFQHLLDTYVSETNKTASIWRAVPGALLDFKPQEKANTIRAIFVHQLLSERRFFAQFVGISEPAVEELLPPRETPSVEAYVENYLEFARRRLAQFAAAKTDWWMGEMPFFGGLKRQRIWTFWRRVLHTCHHRAQVQAWLRVAGAHVPPVYGPSGDVKWSEADPTYSLEAAKRGG